MREPEEKEERDGSMLFSLSRGREWEREKERRISKINEELFDLPAARREGTAGRATGWTGQGEIDRFQNREINLSLAAFSLPPPRSAKPRDWGA